MPISGITVTVDPARIEEISKHLSSEFNAEVSAVKNNLIVVLETEDNKQMKEHFEAIAHLPGVATATLAYYSEETLEIS